MKKLILFLVASVFLFSHSVLGKELPIHGFFESEIVTIDEIPVVKQVPLQIYPDQNGRTGDSLGRWVSIQRDIFYKREKVNTEDKAKFPSLGLREGSYKLTPLKGWYGYDIERIDIQSEQESRAEELPIEPKSGNSEDDTNMPTIFEVTDNTYVAVFPSNNELDELGTTQALKLEKRFNNGLSDPIQLHFQLKHTSQMSPISFDLAYLLNKEFIDGSRLLMKYGKSFAEKWLIHNYSESHQQFPSESDTKRRMLSKLALMPISCYSGAYIFFRPNKDRYESLFPEYDGLICHFPAVAFIGIEDKPE
jgi:hypothetical protein